MLEENMKLLICVNAFYRLFVVLAFGVSMIVTPLWPSQSRRLIAQNLEGTVSREAPLSLRQTVGREPYGPRYKLKVGK